MAHFRPAAIAAPTLIVLLVLTGCTPPAPVDSVSPSETEAPPPALAEPTTTAEPTAAPPPAAERVATENSLVSIAVPSAWTVEHGGQRVDDALWSQTMLVRDAAGGAMAWLSVSEGGDRGGACGHSVDGVYVVDEDSMLSARIHRVETIELGDGVRSVLVAATISYEEYGVDEFALHVGFLPQEPVDALVPCHWYDDVATPDGFPNATFGTPPVDLAGDHWLVDSFEAGEAYTATDEFGLLMGMMRSLELHPQP